MAAICPLGRLRARGGGRITAFGPGSWRSPLCGPWLTAVLGVRARYGSSPLHLLAHLAALTLAAWGLLQALQLGGWERIVLGLAGAVVLHDLVLWPAYTTLDRLARRGRPAGWANYVRVPVGISLVLLLYLLRSRPGSSS
jgi:hypothetical protein